MNLADLLNAMHAIAELFARRVDIVRVVVDEHGREMQRISRGHFYGPPTHEPHDKDDGNA